MNRYTIKKILESETPINEIMISGWVRTRRDAKDFSFIEVNDGSCLKSIQVIVQDTVENYSAISKVPIGASIQIKGSLSESPGKGQKWEVRADAAEIIGHSPEDYPLQKKRHSDEFLRTIAHLRPRTNKYGAAFRIRSEASFLIHQFFREQGFFNVHTPLITGSDCEGAGELFRVTTLDSIHEKTDNKNDFFGKQSNLTVSGQLSAEMMALALGRVYTFGPTFRAENSNTSRHIAEFWMVEPEMAFCDLWENMSIAEEMLVYITRHILSGCSEDIDIFAKFVNKNLSDNLKILAMGNYERISYEEAISILIQSKKSFQYKPEYGKDLQTEHERYITEDYYKKPVFVYNYPKTIKPFYMRVNDDDKTVAAMDLLVPGIGELIGGSQREERIEYLEQRMKDSDIDLKEYWWYLDSRKYGSVPHSGFGLGFERLLMVLTGISNIRDVIPFPRTPGSIEF